MRFASDAQRRAIFASMRGVGEAVAHVRPGEVVPLRSFGKLVRSPYRASKQQLALLRSHIAQLAMRHKVTFHRVPNSRKYPAQRGTASTVYSKTGKIESRSIQLPDIKSRNTYLLGLHELGHHFTPGGIQPFKIIKSRLSRGLSHKTQMQTLTQEKAASRYALLGSIVQPPTAEKNILVRGFRSYIEPARGAKVNKKTGAFTKTTKPQVRKFAQLLGILKTARGE